jgi:hypothetical protein
VRLSLRGEEPRDYCIVHFILIREIPPGSAVQPLAGLRAGPQLAMGAA